MWQNTRASYSTMASSSASPISKSKYDVFLSFRGEDTRHSIVSHLYAALSSRGIFTFKDDERLEIGDHISDELRRAIEGSDFVIVVLSENYATSRWCLMELQLIMELHMERRLVVFPVFYRVEPSAVRHQLGSFDLIRYQNDPQMADKVPRWREALKLIADLSGVESKLCIDEATMVVKIAEDISRRKTLKHNIDFTNIVGVDTHMEGLKSLLDMDSKNDEVRMIGIWGMGGIGKTTIAKCLYAQLSSQFTTSHFTEDIKCIHRDVDLMHLQNKLLYKTLGENIMPWSVEAGRVEIRARLQGKNVLLVLDGVDKVAQIHALAKETRWFGRGSRIIITSRDRGLLNSCGVKTIYEVKCLDDKDSLQMFKQTAFEGGSPPSVDFEQLSIRAAQLAHGLPSALQAYALFLRGRVNSPEEWEEAVCGLESTPDEDLMEILKISYEGLAKPHQDAFLEVACLFNGDTFQHVASLLSGSKDQRNLRIRVLAEKSLINITTNGYVILHKLVEQMGRKIMLDSGKFLRDPNEIQYALDYGARTGQTECISLHTCEMTYAFPMRTSVFEHMRNLKFLKVYKHVDNRESRLQVVPDDHYLKLPSALRLLHWDAFPLNTLPRMQYTYLLVELSLRHSNLETLWSETQVFENLKKLDVTGSTNLQQLPGLSCCPNLDELMLEQCIRLKGIPESIGERPTLGRLNLSYYGGLKSPIDVVISNVSGTQRITLKFPTAKVDMKLMNISIAGAINFVSEDYEGYAEYFSFSSEQQIPATTTISVQQAPQLISEFNKFYTLNIRRFGYKENSRPVTFYRFPDIPSLKELKLVNLNIQNLSDGIRYLEFLEKLDFSGNDFEKLPEDMNRLRRLKTLWLRNCSKLKELPELTQVQSLTLSNCSSLVKLFDSSQEPTTYCLLELCLDNCKNMESLSEQLSHFTKLTFLDLSSHDFTTLPSSIRDLTSLVTLCINNCKKLISVKKLPLSLQFLDAHGCDSLEADALEHFKGRLNTEVPAQPRSDCFQETEMPSHEQDHQATESRLPKFLHCSYFYSFLFAMLMIVLSILISCEQLRL